MIKQIKLTIERTPDNALHTNNLLEDTQQIEDIELCSFLHPIVLLLNDIRLAETVSKDV